MSDVDVRTTDGEEIEVGSDVFAEDADDKVLVGKVILITDPDGDADEEGRMHAINPKVEVEWTNGDKEMLDTTSTHLGWEDPTYEADELYADRTLIEDHGVLGAAEGQGRR
jgi:hypothetical protein